MRGHVATDAGADGKVNFWTIADWRVDDVHTCASPTVTAIGEPLATSARLLWTGRCASCSLKTIS